MSVTNFLSLFDFSKEQLLEMLYLAKDMKTRLNSANFNPLKGKTLAMIFAQPSTRTRLSFEAGIFQLGGNAVHLLPEEINLHEKDALPDIIRIVSRYCSGIMAYLFTDEQLEQLKNCSTIPIINGLSYENNPCQVLGDLLTIMEHKNKIDNLKITFVGDGNNIVNSWLNAATKFDFEFVLSCPQGFEPDQGTWERALKNGANVKIERDKFKAVKNADVVYTDVWVSVGQEAQTRTRKEALISYQVNEELVVNAKKDFLFMHCLPAIKGEEVTTNIFEGKNSVVFEQAENKLHIHKAILSELLS
ncbi:ornithine carbamoyltransferase [bacterium]|nr:ornithine carbamoyltransferase [bacterium]